MAFTKIQPDCKLEERHGVNLGWNDLSKLAALGEIQPCPDIVTEHIYKLNGGITVS